MSDQDMTSNALEMPTFTIGAVSEMSGISEATLRVWERRYGFPRAIRSRGGHRLYSQRDVLELRWVRAQMDAGMRAGRAIQSRPITARDPAVVDALRGPVSLSHAPVRSCEGTRAALLQTLLAYDAPQARMLLDECVASSSLRCAVLDVIGPTLAAIGTAWADGRADVAVEHFATNVLRHQLLKWMQASPLPHRVQPVALACAPGELHEGSLLMLGVLLRQLHWPVVYLGQSVPLADLQVFCQQVQPAIAVFVAMSEESALALAEWPRWLAERTNARPPIVGYGGRAFTENPTLVERIPGTLLGATVGEGCQRIDRVMLHLAVLER